LDPKGEDGGVFEPADDPVHFLLAFGGVGVAAEGEFGVGFGFKDEGAGLLGLLGVGGGEGGKGAGEVGEVILKDAFDGGGEGQAGGAEEAAEVGG